MALLDDNTMNQVKDFFKDLNDDVKLVLYDKEGECMYCNEIKQLLEEVASANEHIKVEYTKPQKGGVVEEAPVISIEGKAKGKTFYYGIPSGHEFSALLHVIKMVATGDPKVVLDDATLKLVEKINEPVRIRVFVTPQCPYCPNAALVAYSFAVANPNIRAETVEAIEFQELATRFRVQAVPKIVANDTVEFEGAMPPDVMFKKISEGLNLKL